MTIPMPSMSRAFHGALLAAMLLLAFATALAQAPVSAPASAAAAASAPAIGGQRAFWCKSPNGVAALQLESCAPGTELRSEPVGPHGRVASPPPVQPAIAPAAPAAPNAPAAGRSAPAVEVAATAPAYEPRRNGMRTVLVSVLMVLGLGLIAKLLGRSFWRWLLVGCVLWIVLALLKVVKF